MTPPTDSPHCPECGGPCESTTNHDELVPIFPRNIHLAR